MEHFITSHCTFLHFSYICFTLFCYKISFYLLINFNLLFIKIKNLLVINFNNTEKKKAFILVNFKGKYREIFWNTFIYFVIHKKAINEKKIVKYVTSYNSVVFLILKFNLNLIF